MTRTPSRWWLSLLAAMLLVTMLLGSAFGSASHTPVTVSLAQLATNQDLEPGSAAGAYGGQQVDVIGRFHE
jgi:hypothetical protein